MKPKITTLPIILGFPFGLANLAKAENADKWMLAKDHSSVNFDISHFFSAVMEV